MAKRKVFRIRHDNGTYFTSMSGIGPTFGGSRDGAKVFTDRYEAARLLGAHFAFGDCELEESTK